MISVEGLKVEFNATPLFEDCLLYTSIYHPPDGRKPYKHRREHPCCYLHLEFSKLRSLNKEDNFNNALTNM